MSGVTIAPGTVRVVASDGRVVFERVDTPLPGPGQVCIGIVKSLISAGTELAKLNGLMGPEGLAVTDSLPLGYSAAGYVVATGPGVESFRIGDRVSAHAHHASAAVADVDYVAALPDTVSFEEGTFGTLGPIAIHAVRLSQLHIGESCAVVGFGLVGQLIALCARIAGARRIGVLEHRPARRALAERLGFDNLADGSFGVVFEAAGTPSAVQDALSLTASCGRTVVAGSLRAPMELDLYHQVHRKGITLIGVHGSHAEHAYRSTVLDFIADKRLPVAALISHRIPAEQASEGFELLAKHRAHAVVLDWE